ncbi:MAG: hypothetical protein ACU843_17670 [Gammaproteobacteria bacterium]
MVIIQICESCGNGFQPERSRIKGKHSVQSVGICDICHCTTVLYDPDEFGLPVMDVSTLDAGVGVDKGHRGLCMEQLS